MKTLEKYLSLSSLLAIAWLAGCDQPQIIEPALDVDLQAARNGPGPQHPAPSPEVIEALGTAYQGEWYLAAMYDRVLADFGDLKPFTRVLAAEYRHVAALERHYVKYDVQPPDPLWNADNVPTFETVLDACVEAVLAEGATVAMYDALLATELPERVLSVFQSLRDAAADNHVLAFERCK